MADEFGPVLTLLVFVIGAGFLLLFAASILVPVFFLKGRKRFVCLATVAMFWVGFYFWNNYESTIRGWAYTHCVEEQKLLPAFLQVDGFTDEGAALRKQDVLKFFTERNIKFIEIKVQNNGNMGPEIAYPDGDQEPGWKVSRPIGSYAKIELGQKGDPDCMDLPYGIEGRVDRPPFLPDTCIKATYFDEAQARYALVLDPKGNPHGRLYSSWTFIDRSRGERLAALTTTDTSTTVTAGNFSRIEGARLAECQAPYTAIANRITGAQEHIPPQLLVQTKVRARIEPGDIETKFINIPTVSATDEVAVYSEAESNRLFNSWLDHNEWKTSIEKAKLQGWANHSSNVVDWSTRRYISLIPVAEGNSYPWTSFALNKGFIVLSTGRSWEEENTHLIVRYDIDGNLIWSIKAVSPPGPSSDPSCRFTPRAISITKDSLVLSTNCAKLSSAETKISGKDHTVLNWKIPLSSLPGNL